MPRKEKQRFGHFIFKGWGRRIKYSFICLAIVATCRCCFADINRAWGFIKNMDWACLYRTCLTYLLALFIDNRIKLWKKKKKFSLFLNFPFRLLPTALTATREEKRKEKKEQNPFWDQIPSTPSMIVLPPVIFSNFHCNKFNSIGSH